MEKIIIGIDEVGRGPIAGPVFFLGGGQKTKTAPRKV